MDTQKNVSLNKMCDGAGIHVPKNSKRVRCPICGRRMIARTIVIEEYPNRDDSDIIKKIPPHKVKGWWKKPKPKKKEKQVRTRK